MKKFFAVLLSVVAFFVFGLSVACAKSEPNGYSFYMPDGAPAVACAGFIDKKETFGTGKTVNYNVVSSDDISGYMSTGKADIIIMPINSASINYNVKADGYKLVSVITHGNLYITSKTEIQLTDLKGQVIGVPGENLVPDLTLKTVLSKAGIPYARVEGTTAPDGDTVGLRYLSAPQIKQGLAQNDIFAGLLPEPAVSIGGTAAMHKIALHTLYNSETNSYPQAALMVKKSVLNANPTLPTKIEQAFGDSVSFAKTNTEDAINAVKSLYETTSVANMTAEIIDRCGIYWQSATDAKDSVNAYLADVISVADVGLGIVVAKTVGTDFFI